MWHFGCRPYCCGPLKATVKVARMVSLKTLPLFSLICDHWIRLNYIEQILSANSAINSIYVQFIFQKTRKNLYVEHKKYELCEKYYAVEFTDIT